MLRSISIACVRKHRRGIVVMLYLRNELSLPDNSELLIENTLGAFGAGFVRGIHSGFPCPE